ncbi:molecular chaperone DjiA [Xanthovirga aplysinae]|uniref:molecular chaperone DjiA n=1 Tax=Xanthovirga aplysinae TaxID=2529853 RepID=UPI0012BD1025|nr:molecular chaperone DjiA [Xanthovirga aplysinae]MTI32850.1 molecular chaperone DjiA [Xanthovirga aplysinae]
MLKWVLGLIGIIFFDFTTAFFLFLIGWVIDSFLEKGGRERSVPFSQPFWFEIFLLFLAREVIRIDKQIRDEEVNFVRNTFRQRFGPSKASEIFSLYRQYRDKLSIPEVCRLINRHASYQYRLIVVQFLFEVAYADGEITAIEENIITRIAHQLHVSQHHFESIRYIFAMKGQRGQQGYSYQGQGVAQQKSKLKNAYKVLGVRPDSTNEEIKKAYKKLAREYHPDKVARKGEEYVKIAEEKFKVLNEAFQLVKGERKFS